MNCCQALDCDVNYPLQIQLENLLMNAFPLEYSQTTWRA